MLLRFRLLCTFENRYCGVKNYVFIYYELDARNIGQKQKPVTQLV